MGQVSLSLCYDIITMLIFSPFISATSPPEINGISTYNNKNQFKYIQSYRCPSFKRILSSTTSNVIKCCRRCGQILNCYAVSYSEIASRCQLFTNQALSSTTFTYFVKLEWEMSTILAVLKNENEIVKFRIFRVVTHNLFIQHMYFYFMQMQY